MKKALFIFSLLMVSTVFVFAQGPRISIDVIVGSRPPAPNEAKLMRMEEQAHPNIAKSMRDIGDALQHLHDAPDDFGGRKGQAETDLRQAYISLRKALYFRLYQDTH